MSGVFNGHFVIECEVGPSKHRMSDIVKETDVNISFFQKEGGDGNSYYVKARGKNQIGLFKLNGTATNSAGDSSSYDVRVRKKYIKSYIATAHYPSPAEDDEGDDPRQESSAAPDGEDWLPPPPKVYPTGVICLRGQFTRSRTNRIPNNKRTLQNIEGLWAPSLETILDDSKNAKELCNAFRYQLEYDADGPAAASDDAAHPPRSGRFQGWFQMDGKKIQERDVTINFRNNSEGHYNIEGLGVNEFGGYKISGTMTSDDHVVTVFRHYVSPPTP